MTTRLRSAQVAASALAILALTFAACGSPGARSASTSPTSAAEQGEAGGESGGQHGAGGGFEGTPDPAVQTAIAQGTPFAFGDRTPSADELTSIAQGTPRAFGERGRPAEIQTAIAQGTPASALRRGSFTGERALTAAATVFGIDAQQLRSELQAPGASLDTIAAARGMDRATLRQKLIDAVRSTLAQSVAAGSTTQAAADQAASAFESNIDSLIDRVGGEGLLETPAATP